MLQLKNSEDNYGAVTKLFHWLMALMILTMLGIGLYMVGLQPSADKLKLYGLHKSTGIVILFLAFLRLSWRQVNYQPPIPEAKGIAPRIFKLMEFAAKSSHALIYVLMFAMPLTGWAMSSAYGFLVSVYGFFVLPNLIAPDKALAKTLENIHDYGAYLLIALLVAHVSAALFHHFFLKDNVLKRMLPALVVILFSTASHAAAPEFQIDKTKSSIKFEAVQNGAPVTGEFKDYNAAIAFDPQNLVESKATVEINMASIVSTYDEVVSTLKTADWFNVGKFPTAVFETKGFKWILGRELPFRGGSYGTNGNLTIGGKTKPVSLDCIIQFIPPENRIESAIADCRAIIKRTDFSVGWKDTAAVKDEVKVMIHIEAISK